MKKIAVLLSPWYVDWIISFLKGLQSYCKEKQVDIHVFGAYKSMDIDGLPNTTGFAIFDLINYKDYDGVIILPALFNDEEIAQREYQRILDAGIPAISVNRKLSNFHYIYGNNVNECRDIVLHLIREHKVRHLAYVGGPVNNLGADLSFHSFLEALQTENIEFDQDDFYEDSDWTYNTAYDQASILFSKSTIPQAVVCINDIAAMAVITAASEHNLKVPDDIKVIGFDENNCSPKLFPSITSISCSSEKMGYETANILLSNSKELVEKPFESQINYRQSCGCVKNVSPSQIAYIHHFTKDLDIEQRFSSHLRHLEDYFVRDENIETLSRHLEDFYTVRHFFEGDNFSILINEEIIKELKEKKDDFSYNTTYGKNFYQLTGLVNGKPSTTGSIVKAKDLIPSNLKSEKACMYLFLPIYNQLYVQGYYVGRDSLEILQSKRGYTWARNFGIIIEKFRSTSIYRMVSEKYRALSVHDALSNLYNRTGLKMYAEPLFNENNLTNRKTVITFVDINNMKQINDRYGHLHGDLAVKTVAEAIKTSLPKGYIAVRYGGDEFVIVGTARKIKPQVFAELLNDKIKLSLLDKRNKMTLPYNLTASLGTKVFDPGEVSTLSEAVKIVDEIMYINKTEFHKKND